MDELSFIYLIFFLFKKILPMNSLSLALLLAILLVVSDSQILNNYHKF